MAIALIWAALKPFRLTVFMAGIAVVPIAPLIVAALAPAFAELAKALWQLAQRDP